MNNKRYTVQVAPTEKAMKIIDEWTQDWPDKPSYWDNSEAKLRLIEAIDAHIAEALADYKRVLAVAENELRRISLINHGPDKASGEWRCQEAAAIADAALAAIAELKKDNG